MFSKETKRKMDEKGGIKKDAEVRT